MTTRAIQLTKGQYAIVDEEDYDELMVYKWYCHVSKDGTLSACRREHGTRRFVYMHRVIASPMKGKIVDHKDGDTLNNTRGNLRVCGHSENNMNKRLAKNNTSGVRGVCWSKRFQRWNASIKIKRQYIWLGAFINKEDAIKARQSAENELFGEFSYANSR